MTITVIVAIPTERLMQEPPLMVLSTPLDFILSTAKGSYPAAFLMM